MALAPYACVYGTLCTYLSDRMAAVISLSAFLFAFLSNILTFLFYSHRDNSFGSVLDVFGNSIEYGTLVCIDRSGRKLYSEFPLTSELYRTRNS
jgi:hypothetical protein